MSASKIEWTGKTWNPTTGCNKVSAGCKNCYAEIMHRRLMKMQPDKYSRPFLDGAFPYEKHLTEPFKWKKGTRVFVNSMSDLFHENISFEYIDRVFIVMAMNPQHTFQILTKRPERMVEYFKTRKDESEWWDHVKSPVWEFAMQLPDNNKGMPKGWFFDTTTDADGLKDTDLIYEGPWPLPNVWLGTSCEDQAMADERIPFLLQVPAAVRFLSCEPLLGPIDLKLFRGEVLKHKLDHLADGKGKTTSLHWVIAGGESGHHARPCHPQWVRDLRDQSVASGIKFFFKQWGQYRPVGDIFEDPTYEYSKEKRKDMQSNVKEVVHHINGGITGLVVNMAKVGKHKSGRMLDGVEWNEYPETALSEL